MLISRTAEYALRATVVIASEQSGSLPSAQIAERANVPSRYLSKVLRSLVEAGIIQSQRGPRGGFSLAKPKAQIALLAIVQAVDPSALASGNKPDTTHEDGQSELETLYAKLLACGKQYERALATLRLADLTHSATAIPPTHN